MKTITLRCRWSGSNRSGYWAFQILVGKEWVDLIDMIAEHGGWFCLDQTFPSVDAAKSHAEKLLGVKRGAGNAREDGGR